MNLSKFYTATANDGFCFTREHGCRFAKDIAGDFNPLHDSGGKKFCIPGDLLFSIALAKLGVSKQMQFTFSGMVSENINLSFEHIDKEHLRVIDEQQKEYLSIVRTGDINSDQMLAANLAKSYVEFSGHTFPHVLVPLMASENVMINPSRPMVIYQSMSIDFKHLNFTDLSLEVTNTKLNVEGKRGNAVLQFCFKDGEEVVGFGEKVMILSGLRPYDETVINEVVVDYQNRKQSYS
jgi:hypothetical protein